MTNKINGKSIGAFSTLSSWNDNKAILVFCHVGHTSKIYRLNVDELLKLVKDKQFKIVKKVKYEYLEVIE